MGKELHDSIMFIFMVISMISYVQKKREEMMLYGRG